MAGAMWALLAGQPDPKTQSVTENDLIAYYPQAWTLKSEFLQSSFQDIPQGEPELVQEILQPWPDRTLLFRLVSRLMRKPTSTSAAETLNTPSEGQLKTYDVPDYACHDIPGNSANTNPRIRPNRHDVS